MTRCSDESSPTPPGSAPRQVIDSLRTVFVARALHVVVELGVPEALTDGPRSCAALAANLEVQPVRLHQLIRTLASIGLFARVPGSGVGIDQVYALTEEGETLLPGHPSCARDLVRTMQGPTFNACAGALTERVRTGRTGPEIALGETFFEHLAANPDEAGAFDRMMMALHGADFDAVVRLLAPELGEVRTLVDVGGGTGELTRRLLDHHPGMHGVVYDLEPVVSGTAWENAESGAARRCEALAGDFFQWVPAGGQVYLLSYVLHDWDDKEAVRILERVAEAMEPDAKLYVVEMVLPDDDSPHPGKTLDMVMATMTSGLERSLGEYRLLFERAGLVLERLLPTSGAVSVLTARPRR